MSDVKWLDYFYDYVATCQRIGSVKSLPPDQTIHSADLLRIFDLCLVQGHQLVPKCRGQAVWGHCSFVVSVLMLTLYCASYWNKDWKSQTVLDWIERSCLQPGRCGCGEMPWRGSMRTFDFPWWLWPYYSYLIYNGKLLYVKRKLI